MAPQTPALLTIEEVVTLTRSSDSSVRTWISTGRLRSVRPGRRRLVPRKALAEFLGVDVTDLGA